MSITVSPSINIAAPADLQPGDQLKFGQWHTVTRIVPETGVVDVKPEEGRATQFSFEQAEQLLQAGAGRRPSWVKLQIGVPAPLTRTASFTEGEVKGNDPAA